MSTFQVEEAKKKVSSRTENWLTEGIVIKVITNRLGQKYHKKKGVVKEVVDKYDNASLSI